MSLVEESAHRDFFEDEMKEIRWGIAGAGAIATKFAEGLTYARGARLQAIASRTAGRAAEFARIFRASRSYESYEQLCADPDVDIVYVATPNECHHAHSLLAIGAGKAVLCEKPFALDVAEARDVFAAARRAGVFCMEGMWMRCSPAFQNAVAKARGGELGDLSLLTAQLGFANRFDKDNRLFRVPGGGALLDLGVYPIALAQSFFGPPSRVVSGGTLGTTGVDECVSIVLEFPGGRQATVSTSIRSELSNSATLYGSRARLRIEAPIYFPTSFSIEGISPVAPGRGRRPGTLARLRQQNVARVAIELAQRARTALRSRTTRRYSRGTGLTCEAEEVMRCLRLGLTESPAVTHQDTLEVMEILDEVSQQLAAR
jgi:predicted dehydrogenase